MDSEDTNETSKVSEIDPTLSIPGEPVEPVEPVISTDPTDTETVESDIKTEPVPEPVPEGEKKKLDILLKATGDAPIMKRKKWSVESDRTIGSIVQFVKKYLKIDSRESLFVYVNQSFAPAPDQIIQNLFDCFESDGKLILHYCKTQAWG